MNERSWKFESRHGTFEYLKNYSQKLTLREVIEKLDSGEINCHNALTVDLWVENIIRSCVPIGKYANFYQASYMWDFPAWALLRHEDGRIFVGAKGMDEKGKPCIGALDSDAFLSQGIYKFAKNLVVELPINDRPNDYMMSEQERRYREANRVEKDSATGLYAEFDKKFDYDRFNECSKIWEAGKNIIPLLMGVPLRMMFLDKERVSLRNADMDNLAEFDHQFYRDGKARIIIGRSTLCR